MNNFRYKLAQFFQGRTGVDALGRTCAWTAVALMLLTTFTHSTILYILGDAFLLYSIWRMLSKNYQKRYYENQKFLEKTAGIRKWFANLSTNLRVFIAKTKDKHEQKKIYRFFTCPSCKQKLRAPKGRGKIQVTCNRCKTQFIKKV